MKTHDPKIHVCTSGGNRYTYEKIRHGEHKQHWYVEGYYYKHGILVEFNIFCPMMPGDKIEGHMFAYTPWGKCYMNYELKKEYSRKGLANILSAYATRILTFETEF